MPKDKDKLYTYLRKHYIFCCIYDILDLFPQELKKGISYKSKLLFFCSLVTVILISIVVFEIALLKKNMKIFLIDLPLPS